MSDHRRSNRKNHLTLFERHSGQAIVLIAIVMVVLLGFIALAIDGGQLYFLQRDAQNASDAALVAALYELCRDPEYTDVAAKIVAVEAAGESAAIQNGFDDVADNVSVTVNVTPSDDPTEVEVLINASKPAQLVQLVYKGPLEVTTRATGHCEPGGTFNSVGFAAFSGGTCCSPKDALDISGSVGHSSTIEGGTHSNGCADLKNGLEIDSIEAPNVTTSGVTVDNVVDSTTDPPAEYVEMPEIWHIEDFQPGGEIAEAADDNGHYFEYPGGTVDELQKNPDGTVKQGIHYTPGSFALHANDYTGNNLIGVSLVALGDIGIGNAIEMFSVYDPPDMEPLPMVFSYYGYPSGDCSVSNHGVSLTEVRGWYGVFYAPYAVVEINSSVTYAPVFGCVIGYQVKIAVSEVDMTCSPRMFPPVSPSVGIND